MKEKKKLVPGSCCSALGLCIFLLYLWALGIVFMLSVPDSPQAQSTPGVFSVQGFLRLFFSCVPISSSTHRDYCLPGQPSRASLPSLHCLQTAAAQQAGSPSCLPGKPLSLLPVPTQRLLPLGVFLDRIRKGPSQRVLLSPLLSSSSQTL